MGWLNRLLSPGLLMASGFILSFVGFLWIGVAYYSFGYCIENCSGFVDQDSLARFGDYLAGTTGIVWAAASVMFVAAAFLFQVRTTSVQSLTPLIESLDIQFRSLRETKVYRRRFAAALKRVERLRRGLRNYFFIRRIALRHYLEQPETSRSLTKLKIYLYPRWRVAPQNAAFIKRHAYHLSFELAPFIHFLHSAYKEVLYRYPGKKHAKSYFRMAFLGRIPPLELFLLTIIAAMIQDRKNRNLKGLVSQMEATAFRYLPHGMQDHVVEWDLILAVTGIMRGRKAAGKPPFRRYGARQPIRDWLRGVKKQLMPKNR